MVVLTDRSFPTGGTGALAGLGKLMPNIKLKILRSLFLDRFLLQLLEFLGQLFGLVPKMVEALGQRG